MEHITLFGHSYCSSTVPEWDSSPYSFVDVVLLASAPPMDLQVLKVSLKVLIQEVDEVIENAQVSVQL